MGKYKSLISDTLIFAVGNFTVKILYFVLMPIYTISLSADEFGLADLLNNTLQLIVPILTLSVSDAVFRYMLDKNADKSSFLSNGFYVLLGGIIVVILGVLLFSIFINIDIYWYYFVLWYIVEALRILFSQYTRAEGKLWTFSLNGIIGAIILLLSTYILVYKMKLGVNGYLLSFVISDIASITFLILRVNILREIKRTKVKKTVIIMMLSYCLPLIPNMLSWWFTNISSRYVIAGFCGLSIAGLFSSASKLPALLNIVTSVFQQSWQIASVREYQNSKTSSFFESVFRKYSFLCLLACSILIVLVPYISKIVLQGEFYNAWIYTPMLLFSALLGCYSTFLGTFYSVVKDNVKAMKSTFWGAGINVELCICTIPFIGVTGALIANALSYFVIVMIRIKDVRNYIYLPINYKQFCVSLIVCLAQAITLSINLQMGLWLSVFSIIFIIALHKYEVVSVFKILKKK